LEECLLRWPEEREKTLKSFKKGPMFKKTKGFIGSVTYVMPYYYSSV